ncbi:MAG: SDR family oxidoreductase [Spirochaetales bacterium]|nr:SDR family oxidoreductase [Spirochaetales bacterium]
MKTVIFTGCAGGMGEAAVPELLSQGWRVIGLDHSEKRLAAQQAKYPSNQFQALLCDLAQTTFTPENLLSNHSWLPDVQAMVYWAGVSKGGGWEDATEQDWDDQFNVQARSCRKLIRFSAPLMQQRGGGSVVVAGSPVGVVGARKPGYAASKAALHGLVMSAARHYGPANVRVNLVLPGPVITYMTQDWSPEKRQSIAGETLLGRLCQPQEVAELLTFLISDKNRYMSGSVVDLTCGSMYGH